MHVTRLMPSRIRDELGWRPSVTIDGGLEKTVRWYLDNERLVAALAGSIWRRSTPGCKVLILVFGKTGQVATELQRSVDVLALGRDQADLSNPVACVQAIRASAPRAVINAAAYTAVDQAEEDEGLATIINGDAPTAIAQACAEMQIPLVHISS